MYCRAKTLMCASLLVSIVTKITGNRRVVNGWDTPIELHPYHVGVWTLISPHWGSCGGSILTASVVLTAAHCANGQRMVVYAGSAERRRGLQTNVKYWLIHPQYYQLQGENMGYDIALLFLVSPLAFSVHIQPVRLAEYDLPPGAYVNVTGWGKLAVGGGNPRFLQIATVPIAEMQVCRQAWKPVVIHDTNFCTGYPQGGTDTCRGDSGGPVVAHGVQYGITSRGKCAQRGRYGIKLRVLPFRSWIQQHTGV